MTTQKKKKIADRSFICRQRIFVGGCLAPDAPRSDAPGSWLQVIYNPGQNWQNVFCFPTYAHMSTLYKLFATLFPPPTSMLLFLKNPWLKKQFCR